MNSNPVAQTDTGTRTTYVGTQTQTETVAGAQNTWRHKDNTNTLPEAQDNDTEKRQYTRRKQKG